MGHALACVVLLALLGAFETKEETGLANLVGEDDGVSPLMKLDSMRHERRAALQGLSDLATASLQRLHKQDQSQTRAEDSPPSGDTLGGARSSTAQEASQDEPGAIGED